MDGLDTLSSCLLSHTIIPPGILSELLNCLKRKLMKHFKEYEFPMTEIHQFYDLPLVSYSYTDNMLVLQIPICVKHYTQHTVKLSTLQEVPVLYHPSHKSFDENMPILGYNQIVLCWL